MAIKYVSSLAGGTGDGTTTAASGSTGAWTLAQMLAATPAAGDEIRVMADGTYSRSATGTVAFANGTAAANIAIIGANSSGVVVDGTRPTIQASAGSITLLNVTGSHIRLDRLIVDGNSQATVTGMTLGANYTRAVRCKATGCTVKGLNIADSLNSAFLRQGEATGCSGTAGIYVGTASRALFCEAYGNTTHGFQCASNTQVSFCISSGNTGGSTDGFNGTSVGYTALTCVAYGNGRDGFNLDSNAGFGTFLANCLSEGNGGEGFGTDGSVKSGAFLLNCGTYSNTSGPYSATNLPNVENPINNTTGSFFTNAASGDFSLNSTANQGALARATGFPGLMPRGTTTGYLDAGVAQHQDAGGGGGGPIGANFRGGFSNG